MFVQTFVCLTLVLVSLFLVEAQSVDRDNVVINAKIKAGIHIPGKCCFINSTFLEYSKTCVERPHSIRPNIGFQDQLWLNKGQKYRRMLLREHSAILSTSIKLPFVIKVFVLSIFMSGLFYRFNCKINFLCI